VDSGVIGTASTGHSRRPEADTDIRIERGELSRVDDFSHAPPWRDLAVAAAESRASDGARR